ncbi:MAG: hypothetical protein KDH96_08230, partial [Candidatus Riesia sp.]|nr:hypothetical protein [Candidatus Riesia sp.]
MQELKIRPIENSKNRVTNYEILNYAGVHQYRYLNKREFDLYTHQTEYEAKVKFSNDLDSKIDRLTDQIRDM